MHLHTLGFISLAASKFQYELPLLLFPWGLCERYGLCSYQSTRGICLILCHVSCMLCPVAMAMPMAELAKCPLSQGRAVLFKGHTYWARDGAGHILSAHSSYDPWSGYCSSHYSHQVQKSSEGTTGFFFPSFRNKSPVYEHLEKNSMWLL